MRFVVIDFEATCDEPYNPDPQEIIEFPAVIVNPGGGSDAREFHSYVRPVVYPRLTPFCAKLTGISQERVDSSPSFPEVLARFNEWWHVNSDDALVVTCGDWDLSSLLPRQCVQHRLGVPDWADQWANLKRIYADNFPHASDRATLAEIAADLCVPLVGRAHSGIDDARNIARVLRRMIEMGASVRNTAVWQCAGCGAENLLRQRECVDCGRSSVELKPGDWACPRCGCGNFARRDKCFDCGTRRPSAAPITALKRGDWLCQQCGEHNVARRERCYECDSAR